MDIKAKCVNTDDVKVEMTFTATLGEWHRIASHLEALPYYAPVSDIKSTIYTGGTWEQLIKSGQPPYGPQSGTVPISVWRYTR